MPAYKLYIMANLFYVPQPQRRLIERVAKRNGATLLWLFAPGYLDDRSASLENMRELTGFRFAARDIRAEANVTLTSTDHPITRGLPAGLTFGAGVDREQYQRPPRIQFMPETSLQPQFAVDDPQAVVLGTAQNGPGAGLAVKDCGNWRSIYCAAPLLPWQLMRNICRDSGVHVYTSNGDMLWANRLFLAVYSQSTGQRTIALPHPVTVEDAYSGEILGCGITSLELSMGQWETRLLLTH